MDSLLKNNSFRYGALFFILLTGLFIRVYHSETYVYGPDQIMHIQMSDAKSVAEVWQFSKNETHPPLGYIIRYFWLKISHSSIWMHMLGYSCDVITILLFYLIGNKLEPGSGLFAALLGALCPIMVNMAQVIRNYSIFLMFITACLYCYLQFMEKKDGKWLLFYMIAAALAAATHFSAAIPLAAMGTITFYTLFREKNWRLLIIWSGANGMVALLLLFFYLQISWALFVYALAKTSFMANLRNTILELFFLPIYYPPIFLPNFIDQMPAFLREHPLSNTLINDGTRILFVVFIYSAIAELHKAHKLFFQLTILSLVTLLILCFFQYYDLLLRHNVWLAPFIILPTSILLYQLWDKTITIFTSALKIKLYPVIIAWLTVSTVLIPFDQNSYRKHDEALAGSETNRWLEYIADHVKSGDVIVSGRAPIITLYYYMLGRNYYRDLPALNDKSYYTDHQLDIRSILMRATDEAGRSYISPAYEYTLATPDDVDILFKDIIAKGWLKDAHNVWFLKVIDADEREAQRLAGCPKLQGEIKYRFVYPAEQLIFFAIPKADLLEVLKSDGKYRSCLQ